MVGVHQRVAAAWRQAPARRRRPRPRRFGGDVDHQLVAPVPVDLRRRHPSSAQVARLHRVLGVEAIDDRHGAPGVAAPPRRRVVLGRGVEATSGHAGDVHLRRRARARPVPTLALEVLVERVAEEVGVLVVARHGEAVHRLDPGVRRRTERQPGQRRCVVRRQPRLRRHPPEPVGRAWVRRLDHLHPHHVQATVDRLAAERPEPAAEQRLTGAGLERQRRGRRAPVEQREAAPLLEHRRVVGEACLVEPGGVARVVDERVLEQPQVAVAAERVHVLVVVPDDRADAGAEELVERGGRRAGGATGVGRQMTRRRHPRRERCRSWWRLRRHAGRDRPGDDGGRRRSRCRARRGGRWRRRAGRALGAPRWTARSPTATGAASGAGSADVIVRLAVAGGSVVVVTLGGAVVGGHVARGGSPTVRRNCRR